MFQAAPPSGTTPSPTRLFHRGWNGLWLGLRIRSRLKEMCDWVLIEGIDTRALVRHIRTHGAQEVAFELIVGVVRWPFLALFVLFMLAVLYRYGACRRSPKWHWVSVGSLFAMVVWLIASAAFSLYVSNFANYDRIYGPLGAVIILLFWLYISFYIVLIGAEINAELELQTAVALHAELTAALKEGAMRNTPNAPGSITGSAPNGPAAFC